MQQNKWFIPGNVPSSKNSRRWTGKYFIASKTVMKYRKDTAKYYKKFTKSFQDEVAKYKSPVFIHFTFIRGTRHKFDYINPTQTVQHGTINSQLSSSIQPCFTISSCTVCVGFI